MNLRGFIIFLFIILFSFPIFAQNLSSVDPDEIKAAFIYNFLKFVTWPNDDSNSKDFLFCVVGETSLLPYLLDLNGQELNNKPLKVIKLPFGNPKLTKCRAIFIGKLKKSDQEKLFKKISQKPILTISDKPGFTEKGGIIEIFLKQDRFRFKVNLSTARKVHLFISSRLLRLAEEVL